MSIFDVLSMIGGLCLFLFGMSLMGQALERRAGGKMNSVLTKMTTNKLAGFFTGCGVTAVIQSSSATTVMVVGFVNSGLMSLKQAANVIMGANVGTTVTGWILSLGGISGDSMWLKLLKPSSFTPILALIGIILYMFTKKHTHKDTGMILLGFATLMFGMETMTTSVSGLADVPSFQQLFLMFKNPLLGLLAGAVLTAIIQSSSASVGILQALAVTGQVSYGAAIPIIMGQNIGTTITANLAAMVANANGKKAARAHLVFNVIGVVLTLIVYRPVLNLIANMTVGMVGSDPYTAVGAAGYDPNAIPMALSLFHTFFNVVNTCLLAWFIPAILKIVDWMVPTRVEDEEFSFRLKYIGGHWMSTAELNMEAAKREIEEFSKRVLRMYTFLPGLRTAKDDEEFDATMERIEKYEEITDRMEMEIANFLTHISEGDLSQEGSQRISAMLRVVDNLESIGDSIYQIAATRKNKRETAVHFDDHLNDNLEQMTRLVQQSLTVMDANLKGDYDKVDMESANAAEAAVNQFRDKLRAEHLDALKTAKYDFTIGNAYSGLYALYEKLGDYVINVSEAIGVKFKG